MATAPPTPGSPVRSAAPILIPLHAPVKLEHVLQRLVEARLNLVPGVRVWRANTGAVATEDRFVRFGKKGQGDLIGLVLLPSGVGQHLEVECKRPGKKQTTDQRLRQLEVERYGGLYVVARALVDAMVPICRVLGLPYELTSSEAIL